MNWSNSLFLVGHLRVVLSRTDVWCMHVSCAMHVACVSFLFLGAHIQGQCIAFYTNKRAQGDKQYWEAEQSSALTPDDEILKNGNPCSFTQYSHFSTSPTHPNFTFDVRIVDNSTKWEYLVERNVDGRFVIFHSKSSCVCLFFLLVLINPLSRPLSLSLPLCVRRFRWTRLHCVRVSAAHTQCGTIASYLIQKNSSRLNVMRHLDDFNLVYHMNECCVFLFLSLYILV